MKKKKIVKRVVNSQKLFCFVSFIFILTCCFWYGGRFVYFYLDSKKNTKENAVTMADILKKENHEKKTFIKSEDDYYFYQDTKDNYLMYSNLLWRIVKINKDNSIMLVLENSITSLAYGIDADYSDSSIVKWMNKDASISYSGVLESKLNDVSSYLVKTNVCTDVVTDVEKLTCKKNVNDYYLGLLSVLDYVKTGGKKSFINNDSISYLVNHNSEKNVWYLDKGVLNTSNGDDMLGVRPTITLSPTVTIKSGNGSETDPYIIEDKKNMFASYVKLDNDVWRIYDFDDTYVKLSFTDYLQDKNDTKIEYIYSNKDYRHNDTVYGSLAYYLNRTYLNSLSYKDIIVNSNYYNGYYGEDNDYDLEDVYKNPIDTHVALLSIGDVILTPSLDNYFTSTGTYLNSTSVYVYKKNLDVTSKKVTNEVNVVPCITIKKDLLTKGNGTKDDPYRTE